ncbi:MAG: mercury methylation ferredoxin HgcB [Pseudomonadota bacterium]
MREFRYLPGVTTLALNLEACVGCGECETVCPQGVFKVSDRKAVIIDQDGCMECGACAVNCPTEAITVHPGVGCAAAIINSWFGRKNSAASGRCCC